MKSIKSQLFIFDLILSIIILIISFSLIFSYYINTTTNFDIYDLNKRLLTDFTNTKINSLNNEEIRDMFVNNEIRNVQNSVSQQVGEFYYYNKIDLAKNLTELFVENFLDKQMNFNFTLQNGTSGETIELYSKLNRQEISYKNASITAVSQRSIFGFNQDSYYGPYIFKIKIWK